MIGLAESAHRVRRIFTMGAQYAYWRDYAPAARRAMFLRWHVAMPLLVRARQAAQSAPSRRAVTKPAVRRAVDRYPPEFSTSVPQNRIPAAALDRLWLRGGLGVLTATGVAMGAVALATYLIAEGNDTGAYISFGVAALVSLGMIAIPEVFLKELKDRLAESEAVHAA